MALFRKDHPTVVVPQSLTAAAFEVNAAGLTELQTLTSIQQPWQAQSWVYYDLVPEVRFAATFIGNALARVRLYGAKAPDDPRNRPIEQLEGPVRDAVVGLRDQFSGQRGLLRDLSVNLTVPGEGYLVGTAIDGKPKWQVCSRDEIRFTGDSSQPAFIKNYPGATPQPLSERDLIIRIWKSHPRYSALADSAMQGIMDECEKLILLSKAEKSSIRSRNAGAGILFIPQELVPPSQQVQGKTADPILSNPLYTQLAEAMMAPLRDEAHPSAQIPTMIFGAAEMGAHIRHILLDRPFDKQAQVIRESAIKRIAVAFDLPTDYLLGLSDATHWTAWSIKDDAFAAHLQPFIEMICDALTAHYLQPALKRAGVPNWDTYLVWYDATDLIARPDKKEAAIEAWDRLIISNEELRRALGFPESAAPDEDERAKRIGVSMADPGMALTGEPTPPPEPAAGAPPGSGSAGRPHGSVKGVHPKGSSVGGPNAGPRDTTAARRTKPGDLPAATGPRKLGLVGSAYKGTLSESLADIDSDLISSTLVLLDEALTESIKEAVRRIRPLVANNRVLRASVASVPEDEIALFLGPNTIARLGFDDYAAIVDSFAPYSDRAGDVFQNALDDGLFLVQQHYGVTAPAEFIKAMASAQFASTLKGLIQTYLFSPTPPKPESMVKTVREMIDSVNGVTSFIPEVSGIATGPIVRDFLHRVAAGDTQNIWLYRTDMPRPTERFNPHLQLDGLTFTEWTDPGLQVPDEATFRFLKREFMAPGDHYGCRCIVAPWIPAQD